MDEDSVIQYISEHLGSVDILEASGDHCFYYDPGGGVEPDRKLHFVTLATGDRHDTVSGLDQPDVYRLNAGVSRDTFQSLFGTETPRAAERGNVTTGHDFSPLDQIMPHPVYAPRFWVYVLDPGEETFVMVKTLLAEAYDRAGSRHGKLHRPASNT